MQCMEISLLAYQHTCTVEWFTVSSHQMAECDRVQGSIHMHVIMYRDTVGLCHNVVFTLLDAAFDVKWPLKHYLRVLKF